METSNPRQPLYPLNNSMSASEGTTPVKRPGALTAICVIAIVLGAMAILGSLGGLVSLATQPMIEKMAARQQAGQPAQAVELNQKFQKAVQAVYNRHKGLIVGINAVNLAFGLSLLIGGILAIRLSPKSRAFLAVVFTSAIIFEIVAASILVPTQLEVGKITTEWMPRIMEASIPPGQPQNAQVARQVAQAGAAIAKASVFVGIAVTAGFALAKVIFYCIAVCYLGRENIRKLFQPAATDALTC